MPSKKKKKKKKKKATSAAASKPDPASNPSAASQKLTESSTANNKSTTSSDKVTVELVHDDGTTKSITVSSLHHDSGAFHINPPPSLAAPVEKIQELVDRLNVDAPTAQQYYDLSKGNVSEAMKLYLERVGRRSSPSKSKSSSSPAAAAASKTDSPRLRNRPSKLSIGGEEGAHGVPLTLSFRVKSVKSSAEKKKKEERRRRRRRMEEKQEQEEEEEDEFPSSDSSGVGVITPRHSFRPPPIVLDHHDGGGVDPLKSCSSKVDVAQGT